MYYKKETAKKLVALEIQNRKEALKLYDQIIPVIQKFDGKVLNKRLETALQKINKHLDVDRNSSSFGISLWIENDHVKSEPDRNGYCTASYVESRSIRLTTALWTYDTYHPELIMLTEDQRIKADVIITALKNGKKDIENHIQMLENYLPKVEEYKARLEALKKEVDDIQNEVPYLIRDYFGLNYNMTNRY